MEPECLGREAIPRAQPLRHRVLLCVLCSHSLTDCGLARGCDAESRKDLSEG